MATASISSENSLVPTKNELNFEVEEKIDSLMSDALPYYSSIFKNLCFANRQNANIICEFIMAEINNQNIKTITKLTQLKYCVGLASISITRILVTRDDINDYLNSLRKTESIDPTDKWI
jgi:hypothetical protein